MSSRAETYRKILKKHKNLELILNALFKYLCSRNKIDKQTNLV
jgi:hypothetical protein